MIKRVLVDNGSFTDILFYDIFSRMNLFEDQLRRVLALLVGFSKNSATVEDGITLAIMARMLPRQSIVQLTFIVIRVSSVYNVILKQLGLNRLEAII